MKKAQVLLVSSIVILMVVLSGVASYAQSSTPEATSEPSSYNDNRINEDIYLGGLALYCQDANGNTDMNTFQNGGITVWGVGGQEYMFLTVDELRGSEEVDQPIATVEPGMTEEPMMEPTATATLAEGATAEPMQPILLARALTPNGQIFFYRVGDDTFALQGNDEHGKFYTYVWTGCSLGSISTDTSPFTASSMSMTATSSAATPVATSMETTESAATEAINPVEPNINETLTPEATATP